jgi:hypothetical protein
MGEAVSRSEMEIRADANRPAQEYRPATGKPLGITGEVAESRLRARGRRRSADHGSVGRRAVFRRHRCSGLLLGCIFPVACLYFPIEHFAFRSTRAFR